MVKNINTLKQMFVAAWCWAPPDFTLGAKVSIPTIDFRVQNGFYELKAKNAGLMNVIIIIVRVDC